MSVSLPSPRADVRALSLARFLENLERHHPRDVLRITRPVDPARYEVTAILKHLENLGKFPLVCFDQPKDLNGEASPFTLLSNIYATRERCALALGLDASQAGMAMSLEYARRLK